MPITDQILNQSIPMHVRSNHALEHATLHVLQESGVNVPMGGISDAGGFWIYGEVDTETILEAAREALRRLGEGESDLAVHPNCGTNIAVGAVSAGALAWLAMRGTQGSAGRRLRRMPMAVLMGMLGYRLAQPLGPKVQEQITTNADVTGLHIVDVIRHDLMGYSVHRVSTRMSA
ncbi:DUF6391 domain-containing protein [Pelolinea submarina]|uniref:Uncharacterized protein n=1 Tax=Pelolinea submarina TaxID=913107 RepID=A0A3E0AB26_9CHLR|nr:DUF6391 domain-containing protein [Pelolinea submarina]REG08658.1 hypothetical protein DFR64_2030 [Pelolinea submarina]